MAKVAWANVGSKIITRLNKLAFLDENTYTPSSGDTITWDGSEWVPDSGTYATQAEVDAHITMLGTSNGSDDTTWLNSALSAGGNLRGRFGEVYLISSPLVVPSDTVLDMTGCTVQLKASSDCQMIRNESYQHGSNRDSNITLRGGTWDRQNNGGSGLDTHSIVMHRVDGLTIEGMTHSSTAGKYAILVGDVTDFRVIGHTFDVASDGVHIQGPADRGVVRDIFGSTGDDTVAITARDYPVYDLVSGGGDVSQVAIENVHVDNSDKAAVKVLAGLTRTVDKVSIRNVSGTTGNHSVKLCQDSAYSETDGGTLSNISVHDIKCHPPLYYGLVQLNTTVTDVVVSGLSVSDTNASAVYFASSAAVGKVVIRDIQSSVDTPNRSINVASGTITSMVVDGVDLSLTGSGRVANIDGTVTRLSMSNVNAQGGESLVYISGAIPRLDLSNVECAMTYCVRHVSSTDIDMSVSNLYATTANGVLRATGTGAATIRGAGIHSTTEAIKRSASQTCRAVGAELRADIDILTGQDGDLVFSTKSGSTGLHLHDGSTYSAL